MSADVSYIQSAHAGRLGRQEADEDETGIILTAFRELTNKFPGTYY